MSVKALALTGRDFCPREGRRKLLPTANADLQGAGRARSWEEETGVNIISLRIKEQSTLQLKYFLDVSQ